MCKKEGTVQLKMKATGVSDELIRLIEFVSLLSFKYELILQIAG